jgi:hypothetical protein
MKILMVITSHDELGNTGRKTGFWLEAQESPHLSDRSKNVGEERLVLQHLGEAMHQRAQPVITHGGQ